MSHYMDAAKRRQGWTSDNRINVHFGMSSVAHTWRVGKALPYPEHIIELAQLGDLDPAQALIDLYTWKAKTPEVVAILDRITATIRRSAALLITTVSALLTLPSAAFAATDIALTFPSAFEAIYILCVKRRIRETLAHFHNQLTLQPLIAWS
jgi:hypothetical protein